MTGLTNQSLSLGEFEARYPERFGRVMRPRRRETERKKAVGRCLVPTVRRCPETKVARASHSG